MSIKTIVNTLPFKVAENKAISLAITEQTLKETLQVSGWDFAASLWHICDKEFIKVLNTELTKRLNEA